MVTSKRFWSIAALSLFLTSPVVKASEALPVRNYTHRVVQLWVYSYAAEGWRRPPEWLAPGQQKVVYFNSGETYYLVFMDDHGRETPVGRYNITQVLKENPTYQLSTILLPTMDLTNSSGVERPRSDPVTVQWWISSGVYSDYLRSMEARE